MVTRTELNEKTKKGEVEIIEETNEELDQTKQEDTSNTLPFKLEDYIAILQTLRSTIKHITTAPTFTPKSFVESFQFFDDGVNFRLYIYINSTWRYVALT